MVFENCLKTLNVRAYGRRFYERMWFMDEKKYSWFLHSIQKTSFNYYYDKLQAKWRLANTTNGSTITITGTAGLFGMSIYIFFDISLMFMFIDLNISLPPTKNIQLENEWTSDQNMKGSVCIEIVNAFKIDNVRSDGHPPLLLWNGKVYSVLVFHNIRWVYWT